jgi:hypothetical protein
LSDTFGNFMIGEAVELRKEIYDLRAQLRAAKDERDAAVIHSRLLGHEDRDGEVAQLQATQNSYKTLLSNQATEIRQQVEAIAQLQTTISQLQNREHVAWATYRHSDSRQWISLCDSDDPGAFKVYR